MCPLKSIKFATTGYRGSELFPAYALLCSRMFMYFFLMMTWKLISKTWHCRKRFAQSDIWGETEWYFCLSHGTKSTGLSWKEVLSLLRSIWWERVSVCVLAECCRGAGLRFYGGTTHSFMSEWERGIRGFQPTKPILLEHKNTCEKKKRLPAGEKSHRWD